MKHTQNLIIGFGKAGKTLAATLAKAGQSVILVEESSQMYGGTCINIGCIPSKKLAFLSYGQGQEISLEQAVAKKNALTGALNQGNYAKFAQSAEIITGKASFIDAKTLSLSLANGEIQTLSADNIFINTGAYNRKSGIESLDNSRFAYNSTSIMQLRTLPQHLVIVGAGYIGIEFAFIFAGFGSQVTILEKGSTFMGREDREIVQSLLAIMEKKGITLHLNQDIHQVTDHAHNAIITTACHQITADAILIAAGRMANTQGLNLAAAGVEVNDFGFIKVNEKLETTAPHIYAMGDVAGSPQFTYMSLDDFRVIRSQLLGDKSYTTANRHFAYSIFTNPPLSHTGLTEEQAQRAGFETKTVKLEAVNIPKAKILEKTDGLLKAVIDAKTDKILGITLLCAESFEMINFMDLAIKQGLTYQQVRDHIFTHPTMSEALNDLFSLV